VLEQPRLRAFDHPLAEFPDPVVKSGGHLVRDLGRVLGCPLRPAVTAHQPRHRTPHAPALPSAAGVPGVPDDKWQNPRSNRRPVIEWTTQL